MALKDIFTSKVPRYSDLRTLTDKTGSDSSETDEDEPFVQHRQGGGQPFAARDWRAVAILVVLLVANLAVMAVSISYHGLRSHPPRFNVRDNDYETRRLTIRRSYLPDGSLDLSPPTDYTGPPRPALETAWEDLQKRTSAHYLRRRIRY